MPTSYAEAVSIVQTAAWAAKTAQAQELEHVQLEDALGRKAGRNITSPVSTPPFDSSAMDGYAVSSQLTAGACPTSPLRLRVQGTIAAGDASMKLSCSILEDGTIPCVEVMTGALFPVSTEGPQYDACVPWEHTSPLPCGEEQLRIIEIWKPPKPNQHHRFAGHDFQSGDVVVSEGEEIGPHQIMALASVGTGVVAVSSRLEATVMTTGSELQQNDSSTSTDDSRPSIPDSNRPFLVASLRSLGLQVSSITGVPDSLLALQASINKAISSNPDILILTGGVSAGKFDFVPEAISNLGGSIHFHHVAIRPGHPVLFASLPSSTTGRDIAMFGLPGNPIAVAACYRFLVVPYVGALQGKPNERPTFKAAFTAGPICETTSQDNVTLKKSSSVDVFRHARSWDGKVVMSSEQSPAKIRPFAHADCWVHVPAGVSEIRSGDELQCYSLNSCP